MSDKLLSLLYRLTPSQKAVNPGLLPMLSPRQAPTFFGVGPDARIIGNEITLYAPKDGENIIQKGYNLNWCVHTCLSIIQKMFGKVPFYVVDIKKDERKTWNDYLLLSKQIHDPRAVAEARRMRNKSIDGIIVDGNLSKFLQKPNRNQSGTMYREMLIGYKKLTGEGNQWFVRGMDVKDTSGPPKEMLIIPKYVLQLISNNVDPWEIVRYQLTMNNGVSLQIPKENIMMWIEANYQFDGVSLTHLRGQPPLEAALLQIQALNEGAVREIKEAVNGGANGLLFRKDAKDMPADANLANSLRAQVNNAVNGQEAAATIAFLAGEYGYLPFGKTSQELQRVELTKNNVVAIANVLGIPPGLLFTDQTYENAREFWKRLIYQTIAPEAYSLRDGWNETLLPMFGMDRERYAIDCDILALPELAQDLKDQVAAVKDATWLSKNEKRIATGYEPIDDEAYDLVPKDEDMSQIGGNLDDDENLLNE